MTLYDAFREPAQPLPPPMVKQSAPVSKAPANQNDAEDFTAADFMAGMVEYECRTAIRSLVALYGFENAREQIARYLVDEIERMPRNG